MIITIIVGLISLGIIIFIHELGHFLTAKSFGITVEAFALGWGRKLFSFRRGETEYRINIFPMGGYCKMKGEEEFRKALAEKRDTFHPSPGSLFSVSPLKRLATYAAGPAANFLLAAILLSMVVWIGYTYTTFSNTVILTSDYPEMFASAEEPSPAQEAGLQTGDQIIELNGKSVQTFSDLQQIIAVNPQQRMQLVIQRNSERVETFITPGLDRSSGAGYIGVSPYIIPEVAEIQPDSSAQQAGLQRGDVITKVNGQEISHTIDLQQFFRGTPGSLELTVQRSGAEEHLTYVPQYNEQGQPVLNFSFAMQEISTPDRNLIQALPAGFAEAVETFVLTIRSIGVLFRGVDTSEAVAGPVRITYLMGDVTTQGFQAGFSQGVITFFQLISFISIALSFANLLPIPALDGGQIIMSLYEAVRKKMISPRKYHLLQVIGFSIIMFIFLFALLSDISFFAGSR